MPLTAHIQSFVNRVAVLGVLALGVASSSACADVGPVDATPPADSASGELGFRLAGPGGAAIVVPVYINGRGPIDLILDTGATITCVDSSLTRELSLPEQRLTIGTAIGVGGAGRVRLHRVDSLRVAGSTTRRLSVCGMDLSAMKVVAPSVRGLLGLNVLRRFTVTLDFERQVLRLAAPTG
ncbi:MAG TPA: retropepsin-like aspartic protease [Gemmatimonadaceae bacterium]|nr:retropepsin-like aspartic protease [Gemmatimonadaceae bacterium]